MKNRCTNIAAMMAPALFLAGTQALAGNAVGAMPQFAWGGFSSNESSWAVQTGSTGNVIDITTDSFPPQEFEFDPVSQRIFWQHRDFTPNGFVRSANLDGSGFQEAAANLPSGLVLDPANNRLFLTEQASNRITQYNLDLSTPAPSTVYTDGVILPSSLDLAPAISTLFYVNSTGSQAQAGAFSIESVSTSGSNPQTLISGLIQVTGLTLDLDAGKIYWADVGVNGVDDTRIERMNFDGTQRETILPNLPDVILDMEIDPEFGRIYWTSRDEGEIKSATLEGQDVQTEVSGLTQPHGLALIPEPTSLAILSVVGLATLRRRRA